MWWSESLQERRSRKNRYLSASSPHLFSPSLLLIVRDFFKFFASLSNQKSIAWIRRPKKNTCCCLLHEPGIRIYEPLKRPPDLLHTGFRSLFSFLSQRLVFYFSTTTTSLLCGVLLPISSSHLTDIVLLMIVAQRIELRCISYSFPELCLPLHPCGPTFAASFLLHLTNSSVC